MHARQSERKDRFRGEDMEAASQDTAYNGAAAGASSARHLLTGEKECKRMGLRSHVPILFLLLSRLIIFDSVSSFFRMRSTTRRGRTEHRVSPVFEWSAGFFLFHDDDDADLNTSYLCVWSGSQVLSSSWKASADLSSKRKSEADLL